MTATPHTLSPAAASTLTRPGIPTTALPLVVVGAWIAVVYVAAQRMFTRGIQETATNDFALVHRALSNFVHGLPVYDGDYTTIDPHYLYSPGGTLLLAPYGLFTGDIDARGIFVASQIIALILACLVSARVVGRGWGSLVAPVLALMVLNSEGGINTIAFGNVNGLIALGVAGYLYATIRGHGLIAGVIIGLTWTIKPALAPLIIIALVFGQWRSLLGFFGIFGIANAVGWILIEDMSNYLQVTLPYLSELRVYANSSIAGITAWWGAPSWFTLLCQGLIALAIFLGGTALFLVARHDRELFATHALALLFIGVFLLSTLGQQYYSMYLLPFFASIVLSRSALHTPLVIVGVIAMLDVGSYNGSSFADLLRGWSTLVAPISYSMVVVATATCCVLWAWQHYRAGGSFGLRDLLTSLRPGAAR